MANDQANLNDPFADQWESPFQHQPKTPPVIDGVLKVAGNSPTMVEEHLKIIKDVLGGTIVDVARVVGRVRDGKQKGHEQ